MFVHVLQDVRKAQSLGFALDNGISIVEGDVAKGARWGQNAQNELADSIMIMQVIANDRRAVLTSLPGMCVQHTILRVCA